MTLTAQTPAPPTGFSVITPGSANTRVAYVGNGPRSSPYMGEAEPIVGWEVELPSKTIGSFLNKREVIRITHLPVGLSQVMGEAEYLEQVAQLNILKEKLNQAERRLRFGPILLYVLALVLVGLFFIICSVLAIMGVLSDNVYSILSIGTIGFVALSPAFVFVMLVAEHYAAQRRRAADAEMARATAHWAARGIAWKHKLSAPIARLTGGKHKRVIATYETRIVVELAPNAIELFQAHGPFPTTESVPTSSIESDYDATERDSLSRRSSSTLVRDEAVEQKPGVVFDLPYVDFFFNQSRYLIPRQPLMLTSVMTANEYAEQVGVFNDELDKLNKPYKLTMFASYCGLLLVTPLSLLAPLTLFWWQAMGYSSDMMWVPVVACCLMFFTPLIIVLIGFVVLAPALKKRAREKARGILRKHSAKWDTRGIEWFLSHDNYLLRYRARTAKHQEERVSVRVLSDAPARFRQAGEFPCGALNAAASTSYIMTPV